MARVQRVKGEVISAGHLPSGPKQFGDVVEHNYVWIEALDLG
jgi:hypothetical protein